MVRGIFVVCGEREGEGEGDKKKEGREIFGADDRGKLGNLFLISGETGKFKPVQMCLAVCPYYIRLMEKVNTKMQVLYAKIA